MSKNEWWGVIAVIIAGIIVLAALMTLVIMDNERDKKEFTKNCENISKVSNADDFTADGYDCYILQDGKIKEIKL